MDKRPVIDRLNARSATQKTPRSNELGDCLVITKPAKNGYGYISIDGKTMLAHRAAWEVRHGPIPPETPWVLHHCDNPPCWRDDHLYLGTPTDNASDREQRGHGGRGGRRQMVCKNGHARTPDNLVIQASGKRLCRKCLRAKESRRAKRRRQRVALSRS